MPGTFRFLPRLLASVAAVAAAFGVAAVVAASPAAAGVTAPAPRIPTGLSRAIEPLATYVGQDSCTPTSHPGTVKLAHLLATTYRGFGGGTWQSSYPCGTDGSQSEHYEGRAIDWMVSVSNARQHAAALAVIKWLLATDGAGNRFAMARRLGVMYLIYDNRMWGAWDGRWEQYNGCYKLRSSAYANACHRTHVHISLSWNGAMGHTTFWTTHVWPTDFGPCRARDLNWAYMYTGRNLRGCPDYPKVSAPRGASDRKRALVQYSGASVHLGWSGPAVSAVQHGLWVHQSGHYDTATANAVRGLQRRHHLPVTGGMNPETWRMLMKLTK